MSTQQLNDDLDNTQKGIREVLKEHRELLERRRRLRYDDPGQIIIEDELSDVRQRYEALSSRYDRLLELRYNMYHRPQGAFSRYITRVLPPLPEYMARIRYGDSHTREIAKSLPSYRVVALGTIFALAAIVVILSYAFPALWIGPLSLLGSLGGRMVAIDVAIFGVLGVIGAYITLLKRDELHEAMFIDSIEREMWFRSGAENWTVRQRIIGSLAFGVWHPLFLFLPLVSIVFLGLSGAVMMAVYLADYRQHRDVEHATLASAKFNAVFNVHLMDAAVIMAVMIVGIHLFV